MTIIGRIGLGSHRLVLGALFVGATLVAGQEASAVTVFVGNQDFAGGTTVPGVAAYNAPQADENPALHNFNGSDFGANFSQAWSFGYAAGAYAGASITLGLFDYDCFAPCNVVGSFTVDGTSFAAPLLTQIQTTGQVVNAAYDLFTVDLSSIVGALGDGTANVSLTLAPPPGQAGNGAGLDFARLDLRAGAVPEPGVITLLGLGLIGLASRRRA